MSTSCPATGTTGSVYTERADSSRRLRVVVACGGGGGGRGLVRGDWVGGWVGG